VVYTSALASTSCLPLTRLPTCCRVGRGMVGLSRTHPDLLCFSFARGAVVLGAAGNPQYGMDVSHALLRTTATLFRTRLLLSKHLAVSTDGPRTLAVEIDTAASTRDEKNPLNWDNHQYQRASNGRRGGGTLFEPATP
jgi:hypothetical protein